MPDPPVEPPAHDDPAADPAGEGVESVATESHVVPVAPTDLAAPIPQPATPGSEVTPSGGAPEPAWSRTYELPTARKVVTAGLQLAVAASHPIRRASIYIGLLVLASFGPGIVAALLTLGRLGDQGWEMLGLALFAPGMMPEPDPALTGVILALALMFLLGLLLFMTISVDAQVIAIALLGGRASEQPLRLWEAIIRARQAFWRMVGAGSLVGVVSVVLQLLLLTVFGGFSAESEAASLLTTFIVTLVLAPFAYVSTAIVLGDVGVMESISRSWRLFRAKPRLAVVVVLFTVLASAIQLFALGAGLELVIGAADILQVSLTEGALALVTAVVLILAVVVAFGSLTFTVGAIVVAPQVTGFLGLTFYSAGLDRARVEGPRPPRGFRWITRPMLGVMAAIALLTAVEVPAINSIVPPPVDPIVGFVRNLAADRPEVIDVYGTPTVVEDPTGDVVGAATGGASDIVLAEFAFLADVPDWLIDEGFDCAAGHVACSDGDRGPAAFEEGALLFLHRASSPVDAGTLGLEAAVLLAVEGDQASPRDADDPYSAASHAFVVSLDADPHVEALRFDGSTFATAASSVRSTWSGTDVFTIVPFGDYNAQPMGWDVVLLHHADSGISARDTVRTEHGGRLRDWSFDAWLFVEAFE